MATDMKNEEMGLWSQTLIDREMLMVLKKCAACGRRFNLGEPVVKACGTWDGPARWIHEEEAEIDSQTGLFVERKCFEAGNRGACIES